MRIQDAEVNVKNLAKNFQSVIDVAKALEKIGGLEQAEKELTAKVNTLVDQALDGEDKVKEINGKYKKVQEDMDSVVDEAREIAAEVRAKLNEDKEIAKAAVSHAYHEADRVRADAEDHEKEMRRAFEVMAEKNQEFLDDLNKQIEERKAALAELNKRFEV